MNDDLYEPTPEGLAAAGMTDEALWASITEDTRGLVDAMRQATEEGWRGVPPEKLLAVARFIEDALPVNSQAACYELAKRLRHVGLMPRERR